MQTLIGLLVVVALGLIGLAGLQAGGQVPQATIILLSTILGVAVWRVQESAKRTQELEVSLVTDKAVLYKVYLDVLRDIFLSKPAAKELPADAMKKLTAFVFGSLLIASDDVVIAHDRFMRASNVGDDMVLPAVADVVLAMRRDAGDPNTTLRPIDTLAGYIKDIESLTPAFDTWAQNRAQVWPGPPTLSRNPQVSRRR